MLILIKHSPVQAFNLASFGEFDEVQDSYIERFLELMTLGGWSQLQTIDHKILKLKLWW